MKLLGTAVRAMAIALALVGGSMAAKPAKADGGAVVAGIAGGLILGTIIGSTANANNRYYSSAPTYYAPRYYAPAPIYRPYYGPSVSFSIGTGYYGGHRYRSHRRHYGHGYRKFRGHRRGFRRHRRH